MLEKEEFVQRMDWMIPLVHVLAFVDVFLC